LQQLFSWWAKSWNFNHFLGNRLLAGIIKVGIHGNFGENAIISGGQYGRIHSSGFARAKQLDVWMLFFLLPQILQLGGMLGRSCNRIFL